VIDEWLLWVHSRMHLVCTQLIRNRHNLNASLLRIIIYFIPDDSPVVSLLRIVKLELLAMQDGMGYFDDAIRSRFLLSVNVCQLGHRPLAQGVGEDALRCSRRELIQITDQENLGARLASIQQLVP